jgi:hypothetical protein
MVGQAEWMERMAAIGSYRAAIERIERMQHIERIERHRADDARWRGGKGGLGGKLYFFSMFFR